jgi:hypothetical protein
VNRVECRGSTFVFEDVRGLFIRFRHEGAAPERSDEAEHALRDGEWHPMDRWVIAASEEAAVLWTADKGPLRRLDRRGFPWLLVQVGRGYVVAPHAREVLMTLDDAQVVRDHGRSRA